MQICPYSQEVLMIFEGVKCKTKIHCCLRTACCLQRDDDLEGNHHNNWLFKVYRLWLLLSKYRAASFKIAPLSPCCLYSVIHWNWNKVNFYIQLWNLSQGFPIGQNNSHIGTFWYLRHFGTSRSSKKCHGFHLWLSQIEGNWWEKTTRHPFQPPVHPPTPPKHLWTLQNTLRDPKHIPLSARNSLDFYKALVIQSERHLSGQGMSGGTLWEMRVSEDVCWVSGVFVSVYGCIWQCQGYVRGVMGVSGDIWGCLGGV